MLMPRKDAINQGRAMIAVISLESGKSATIGVCPACWNSKARRKILLLKLKNMGYRVEHKNDTLQGLYRIGKSHAPRCPYSRLK
jgi:hypothetical protein